jgi:sialidase-1
MITQMRTAILTIVHLRIAVACLLVTSVLTRHPAPADPPRQNVVPRGSVTISFERAKPGDFTTLNCEPGKWTTVTGRVLIDNKHASAGKQCLQLAGGPISVVELELTDAIAVNSNLTFRAERWTKRGPFSFRVEKTSGNQWEEIYNGDQQIKVGRSFLSTVNIPLNDKPIKRLRFSVTSPASTGVLLDDLRIAPPRRQKITGVEVIPFALPALIGKPHCAIAKLKIETTGRLNPIALREIQMSLNGTTDRTDVATVHAFYGSETFSVKTPFGDAQQAQPTTTLRGTQALQEGTNYVWLACSLAETANIDHRVGATIGRVVFSDGQTFEPKQVASVQQMGIAVRKAGDDGVHTYRIPGLATTKAGSLIAVYDVRHRSGGDLPGDIDVGMSRSIDGGRTWQPMRTIMDMGDDPNFRFDGVGDPTVLVDKTTGTIWCAATWSHGNRSWVGSGPGLTPDETGQFMLARSDDDGITWSKPINITRQIKKPEWSFLLQGPGKGITMNDGTIVFPVQYQDPPNATDKVANRLPHSAFIFSRDHGQTWSISTGAYADTTESQVVELTDGRIMINCRYNRESKRVVMTTDDMGQTWNEHPTNRTSLIEPRACMGSIINVGRELRQLGVTGTDTKRDDLLLFSNPNSTNGRNHITIKASLDGGLTWLTKHQLLLDEQTGRGYSCMTMIDAETVGIMYEGSQADLTFQRIKLADILKPPKNQKTASPFTTADRFDSRE